MTALLGELIEIRFFIPFICCLDRQVQMSSHPFIVERIIELE